MPEAEKLDNGKTNWTLCPYCQGRGKKSQRIRKKAKIQYQKEQLEFKQSNGQGKPPSPPKGHLATCKDCSGSGLIASQNPPKADTKNYPHVAIIGGGIGGVALAVACLHRGIPFTLYERDLSFDARPQGYGLTLQQARKAMEAFGLFSLKEGLVSTRHIVHTSDGKEIGEWGMRKWMENATKETPRKTNIHISRQSLRLALLKQLDQHTLVKWGHQFINCKEENKSVTLQFNVNEKIKNTKADLLVGADGIRSSVRKIVLGEEKYPLQYLGCIVILGICPLDQLGGIECDLLDSATVFQTVNGFERIYMMPYSKDAVMWQFSFPMEEKNALALSKQGVKALKEEAIKRTKWHSPIPQIVKATKEAQISGYPVYDRAVLKPDALAKSNLITLLGDAAHPMSPFKGQGANQALLDALALAREITKGCRPQSQWREEGLRKCALNDFESEMFTRSAIKVKDSAKAARLLHSEIVLQKGNQPRGRILKE